MSTTTHRPVDLAPGRQARPGLALLLALLAVPGSTVAWELPAGGFWIGLPLAVAAVVLGVAALRHGGEGRGRAIAAIVVGGAMIAFMATWTVVDALG